MASALDSFQIELVISILRLSSETKNPLDLRKLFSFHLRDSIKWEINGTDRWVRCPDFILSLVGHSDIIVDTKFF